MYTSCTYGVAIKRTAPLAKRQRIVRRSRSNWRMDHRRFFAAYPGQSSNSNCHEMTKNVACRLSWHRDHFVIMHSVMFSHRPTDGNNSSRHRKHGNKRRRFLNSPWSSRHEGNLDKPTTRTRQRGSHQSQPQSLSASSHPHNPLHRHPHPHENLRFTGI